MANSRDYILSLFPDNVNNEITASDLRIFVRSIFDEEVDITDIQDNLISTNAQVPLSANQGRVLDEKISSAIIDIGDKEDSLGIGNTDQVLSIDAGGRKIWRDLPSITQVNVYDALDSNSASDALSANQGRVLDGKVNNNIASINTINSNLSGISSSVSSNTTNISSNTGRINTIESDINDINSNKIPSLQNKDTQLETNINSNSTRISSLETSNTGLTQSVNNIEADITALQNKDTSLDSDISNITARVSTNEGNISSIQTQIGNINSVTLESRVTVVEGNYSAFDSRITSNSDNIAVINTNITGLQSQINTNTSNVSSNLTKININSDNISTLGSRINSIDGDINTLENKVNTNTGDITNLNNQIIRLDGVDSSLRDDIDTNRSLIDSNSANIATNTQDISNIKQEQAQQNSDIQSNKSAVQNNSANITHLLDQNASILNSISSLEMDVNGSPDGTIPGKEDNLGAPYKDNMILGSLKDGTRVWVDSTLTENLEVIDNITDPTDNNDKLHKQANPLSAYQGVVLKDMIGLKEDNLGIPQVDGMILISNADGSRIWKRASEVDIDCGYYLGSGATLLRINVIDPVGGIIDNKKENAVRQLICTATYNVIDSEGNLSESTVDVTNSVDWVSSNDAAYTITDGSDGGLVRCTTQNSSGNSYSDIPVKAMLYDDSGNLFESSINISIDNTPVVRVITINPSDFSLGVNDSYQLIATAEYTNGNWNNSQEDITSSSSWYSNNTDVATVDSTGNVSGVAAGNALITSSVVLYDNSVVTGNATATVS